MADFTAAVDIVIAHEGGYVDNPDDPGGETKYGISKRVFPKVDIANLTEAAAKAIYHLNYWNSLYDKIGSQDLANKLFDLSVNLGTTSAVKLLQESAKVDVDGVFGAGTLDAINKADPSSLLSEFKARAAQYYSEIAINHPSERQFLLGWLRRAVA